MSCYRVSRSFGFEGAISEKMASVMRMFGVSRQRLCEGPAEYTCEVEINPGEIVYITGPSGSGKSVLLRELEKAVEPEKRINLSQIELAGAGLPRLAVVGTAGSVVDRVEGDFLTSLKFLSTAGLSDVFCVLNEPARLSEGEQYRFRLAMALASGAEFIFADEFCTNLDRITAAVIAYKIRRFADKNNVSFILAASYDDVLIDLCPDVIVRRELSGGGRVIYRQGKSENAKTEGRSRKCQRRIPSTSLRTGNTD